jgi:hypothetical protein
MNKEDVIRIAREAGLDPDLWNYTDAFERFAAIVAAAEREACAREADYYAAHSIVGRTIAESIRARGKE